MTTADHDARQRFACELDENFSVIASAGSGKTRAITDRIVELARSRNALKWLPHLVVVTYTNRAADEMQQRTRQQILESDLSLDVVEAFNRAFFGTIHSFCMKLLAAHGHHLGLPRNLELITDDEDLWNQFVQQYTTIGRSLNEQNRRILLRHVQARHLMNLARNSDIDLTAEEPAIWYGDINFAEVYRAAESRARAYNSTRQSGIETVGKTMARNGRVRSLAPLRHNRERFCSYLARGVSTVARLVERVRPLRRRRGATRLSRVPTRTRSGDLPRPSHAGG